MKSDSEIQMDVIQELKWDPSVTHEHIGVAVTGGIVTLSGAVPSFIDKSAAEKAAKRVGGVKAVVEEIEVKIPGLYHRGDQDIAKTIIDHFHWSTQIPDELVKVSVENGSVELSGEVEWEYQRRAAEKVVRGLTGVRGIWNKITIKPKAAEPVQIKNRIEEALQRATEREVKHITIEVNGSRVRLSGKVRSFAELADVRGAAWGTPGVTSVDDKDLYVAA
jgi:osmotically-inducible protein OsmY